MKRKRKAEEKTSLEEGNKRQRAKSFEDPLTVTSLDDKKDNSIEEVKPKPKRKPPVKKNKLEPGPPPELVRQTCEDVQLEFCEIKNVSEANNEIKKEEKAKAPVARKPRKKAN